MGKAVKVRRGFRLADLDMGKSLADEAEYLRELKRAQLALLGIQQTYRRNGGRAILIFEGWDAAGKGGSIKRLVEALDPHDYHVWPIGKPTPEEQAHHYLYRFWQRLPASGDIAIFDRSWYGRVLVERVDKLAQPAEWRRAYDEINAFEAMLARDGTRLVKLFLHVSAAEQLRRFAERIASPYKRWKIGADDIRNHLQRDAYRTAIDDMFARTSSRLAPWFAVPADAKWYARVAVLKTVVDRLGQGLDLAPPALDPDFVAEVRRRCGPALLAKLGLDKDGAIKSSRSRRQ